MLIVKIRQALTGPSDNLPRLDGFTRQSPSPVPEVNPSACAELIAWAQSRIRGPAIGIVMTGIANVFAISTVCVVQIIAHHQANRGEPAQVFAAALIIGVIIGVLQVFGAWAMSRLRWYSLAVAVSILSLLISPGNLIGLPIGIWALVMLTHSDVRMAFRRQKQLCANGFASANLLDSGQDSNTPQPNTDRASGVQATVAARQSAEPSIVQDSGPSQSVTASAISSEDAQNSDAPPRNTGKASLTPITREPWTWEKVPWQIWIVVAMLGMEGIGNLLAIPTQPQAAQWFLAKCLFVVGLLRGWRWVFVLYQIVGVIHVLGFLGQAPGAAILNLLLMGLVFSAFRFYFPHSIQSPAKNAITAKSVAKTTAIIVALNLLAWPLLCVNPTWLFNSIWIPNVENRSLAPVAEALEEYRQTLAGYDLGFHSVFPDTNWTHYDAQRLQLYPTKDAWPKVLGHVDVHPTAFTVIEAESQYGKTITGPNAFAIPLSSDLATEAYTTLLFLNGIASKGTVEATSYTSLVCLGDMAGRLTFDSYATALVKGNVSGQITGEVYFNLVVKGQFSGQIVADAYAMIYLEGGCEGKVALKEGAKVYIAGRTLLSDLRRITGRGNVYLEESDLTPGEHKIGDLKVTVGKGSKSSTHSGNPANAEIEKTGGVQRDVDASVDVNSYAAGPWIAQLKSGVKAELVGVGKADDDRWWQPDGSMMKKPPCIMTGSMSTSEKDTCMRQFFIRFHNLPAQPVGMECETNLGGGGCIPERVKEGNRWMQNRVAFFAFGAIVSTKMPIVVRCGVSDGRWEDVSIFVVDNLGERGAGSTQSTRGSLTKPVETKDGVATVTADTIEDEIRVIAICKDGREVSAQLHSESSISMSQTSPMPAQQSSKAILRTNTAIFSGLQLKQIETIKLQCRPYHWVEFRNVALNPKAMSAAEKALPTKNNDSQPKTSR